MRLSRSFVRVFAVAAACVVVLGAVGCLGDDGSRSESVDVSGSQSGSSDRSGIWVTGVGSKTLEADVARVSLGVESSADTVAEARDVAASGMEAVLRSVRSFRIRDEDIVTTSFDISPLWVWVEVPMKDGGSRSERRLTGYTVSNSVGVTVREIGSVGDVIDGAAAAAGDLIRVNSVSFGVDDPSRYSEEVRMLATEDAMEKARVYAAASGLRLGPLVYLQEVGPISPVSPQFAYDAGMESLRAAATPTPIESGGYRISVSVTAGFSILP